MGNGDKARTDIPLSGVTPATKSNFRETISSISAGGSTALSAGLFRGSTSPSTLPMADWDASYQVFANKQTGMSLAEQ